MAMHTSSWLLHQKKLLKEFFCTFTSLCSIVKVSISLDTPRRNYIYCYICKMNRDSENPVILVPRFVVLHSICRYVPLYIHIPFLVKPVMWIRIRSDPDLFGSVDPDPVFRIR